MRICRIVDSFPVGEEIIGGLGPNWYYYSKLCVEKGMNVHVVCGRLAGQPEEEDIEGIKVHRVSSSLGHRSSLYGEFARRSMETLLKIDPDLIHGHNAYHISVVMRRKKINSPLITHLHGSIDLDLYTDKLPFHFDFKRALWDRLYCIWSLWKNRYVTQHADLVIACDNYTANSVYKYFPEKLVRVVYNGVELERFKRVKGDLKEFYEADNIILFVGRPTPWKGIQYILQAMPQLNKRYRNLKCLLVGVKREEGYYKTYYRWFRSIAENLRLKNIEFLKPVPYFDLPKYYSTADCLVVPSYPDPSPKVVYEGQACSCPIVGANGGGIPEIFGQESGLLFEPRNVQDLVDKIDIVLRDPDKFRGGRKTVQNRATWEKCVEDMIKCYELLLDTDG